MNSINLIKKWLEETVIGLNLCPFAKTPFEEGKIALIESQANEFQGMTQAFLK